MNVCLILERMMAGLWGECDIMPTPSLLAEPSSPRANMLVDGSSLFVAEIGSTNADVVDATAPGSVKDVLDFNQKYFD